MANDLVIKVENLSNYLGEEPSRFKAIENINLEIFRGQKLIIVGENGTGKSTLARHLNGLLEPDEGRVLYFEKGDIKGIDLSEITENELYRIRRKIGFVFQRNSLFSSVDMSGNVMSIRAARRGKWPFRQSYELNKDEIREVKDILIKIGVGEFFNLQGRLQSQVSGGQRKIFAIARTVASNPEIMIYDEPTSELSSYNEEVVSNAIYRLHEQGKTTIVITNVVETLKKIGKRGLPGARVVMLYKETESEPGRVRFNGTYQEFISHQDEVIRRYLHP